MALYVMHSVFACFLVYTLYKLSISVVSSSVPGNSKLRTRIVNKQTDRQTGIDLWRTFYHLLYMGVF